MVTLGPTRPAMEKSKFLFVLLLINFQFVLPDEELLIESIKLLKWKSFTVSQQKTNWKLMRQLKERNEFWKIITPKNIKCAYESNVVLYKIDQKDIEKCFNEVKQSFFVLLHTEEDLSALKLKESIGFYQISNERFQRCYIQVQNDLTMKTCKNWNDFYSLSNIHLKGIRGNISGDNEICENVLKSLAHQLNFTLEFHFAENVNDWRMPLNYSDISQYLGKYHNEKCVKNFFNSCLMIL